MKRLYIAIIFILIALSLCITEQITIKNVYVKSSKYIDSAISSLEEDDYDSTLDNCKKLKDYWDGVYPFLTAMTEHTALDEMTLTVNSLQKLDESESDDMKNELYSTKNQLKLIYDTQKITFGNIF